MKANVIPLEPERYYHIYNRGINGCDLFYQKPNYDLFLQKYFHYTHTVAETFAYCLLKNHFHFLIKIKPEEEIRPTFHYKTNASIEKVIVTQFSHFFNSYAQIINKTYQRTGGLFENPFRRIMIHNDNYFMEMIFYIHNNPVKHGFWDDFRDYPYASYGIYADKIENSHLNTEEVLSFFGSLDSFISFHQDKEVLTSLEKYDF